MRSVPGLLIRALLIGFALTIVFESMFVFVPLPDIGYEALLFLSPGMLCQMTIWWDQPLTESRMFLTNLLGYAAVAFVMILVRRRHLPRSGTGTSQPGRR